VIANTKKIEVIYNDGSKEEATVVRKSAEGDVALLKVARKDLSALPISELKDTEIGVDVWAIGTPRSLELGQSVSKGIISGLRKTDNVTYVQTDVKISPGNSGGALVNKEGLVIGIVTSKVMSIGTEGIGFAVIGGDLMEKLKIKFVK
jgi:S1-C subfamily serine protease